MSRRRDRDRGQDLDVWPDNLKEVGAWAFFVTVILLLVFFWITQPFAIFEVQRVAASTVSGTPTPASEPTETLYLAPEDAAYMNRIYREVSVEVGYCGLLEDKQLRPWLANTVNASRTGLAFSTRNCPGTGVPRATIHTHPSGNLGLSMQDKATFVAKDYTYMCIHAGQLPITVGKTAKNLQCYTAVEVGGTYHFSRVQVVIGDGTRIAPPAGS